MHDEDQKTLARVQSRTNIETMRSDLRAQLDDPDSELSLKIEDDDKTKLEDALGDLSDWLEDNKDATVEENDARLQEFRKTVTPIFSAAGLPVPGGYAGGGVGAAADEDEEEADEEHAEL